MSDEITLKAEAVDQAVAELVRLRRVNEGLVEALRLIVSEDCNCWSCDIARAALRSATETKGETT